MLLSDAITLLTTTSDVEKQALADITGKITSLQSSIDTLTAELANSTLTDTQAAAVQSVVDGANALNAIVPVTPVA